MTPAAEAAELDRIEQRLAVRFVPPLAPADVRRCLAEATALFEGAPIRTYVVLLVERIATDRLRTAAATGATPSALPTSGRPMTTSIEQPVRVVT